MNHGKGALATTVLTIGLTFGMATASATPADDRLLQAVANLGIEFPSPGDSQAPNFMWAAVDSCCPQSSSVVGD